MVNDLNYAVIVVKGFPIYRFGTAWRGKSLYRKLIFNVIQWREDLVDEANEFIRANVVGVGLPLQLSLESKVLLPFIGVEGIKVLPRKWV